MPRTAPGAETGESTTTGTEQWPFNIHNDPRVKRGRALSHVPQLVPPKSQSGAASGPPTRTRISAEQRELRARIKRKKARPTLVEIHDRAEVVKERIPVPLDAFLVEQEAEATVADRETQCDEFRDVPPEKPFIYVKAGIDQGVQVESSAMYNFDLDVAPIVDVIVGKTVEQALVEVREEETIRKIREQKDGADSRSKKEVKRMRELDDKERKLFEKKEKLVREKKARLEKKQLAKKRAHAAEFARHFLSDLPSAAFTRLAEEGVFESQVRARVETEFMPWLYARAAEQLGARKNAQDLLEDILHAATRTLRLEVEAAEQKRANEHARRNQIIRLLVQLDSDQAVPPFPVDVSRGSSVAETVKTLKQCLIRNPEHQFVQALKTENLSDEDLPSMISAIRVDLFFNKVLLSPDQTLLELDVDSQSEVFMKFTKKK
eukprot:1002538_1